MTEDEELFRYSCIAFVDFLIRFRKYLKSPEAQQEIRELRRPN